MKRTFRSNCTYRKVAFKLIGRYSSRDFSWKRTGFNYSTTSVIACLTQETELSIIAKKTLLFLKCSETWGYYALNVYRIWACFRSKLITYDMLVSYNILSASQSALDDVMSVKCSLYLTSSQTVFQQGTYVNHQQYCSTTIDCNLCHSCLVAWKYCFSLNVKSSLMLHINIVNEIKILGEPEIKM